MATKKKGRKSAQNSKESTDSKDSKEKSGKDKAGSKAADSRTRKDSARGKKSERRQGGLISDTRQFLKDVAQEYRKITWPGRAQVVQETYSVIVLVTLITLMVLGMDWVFSKFVFAPIEDWARYMGGGIGRI